jgi:hypothetical protein
MKKPTFVSTLLALVVSIGCAGVLSAGCDGEVKPGDTGGGGSGGETTTTTGGAGGATTTVNAQCDQLCQYLDAIDCSLLANCATDCPNNLNAPADCVDEAQALIDCWVANLNDFACTQKGAIPPAACGAQEVAFNKCVGGDTPTQSCLCSNGVGVGGPDVSNCSRKTTCGAQEFNHTCQQVAPGQPWVCTCLLDGGLLGTCTEPEEYEHCSNDFGCCVPLFCAASSE